MANPEAGEREKIRHLLTGLPCHLKIYFVTNEPRTVTEFTNGLKNASRIQQLTEQSALTSGNLGIITTLMSNPTIGSSPAIAQLLAGSAGTSHAFTAFQSPQTVSQMSATVNQANGEQEIKRLREENERLKK